MKLRKRILAGVLALALMLCTPCLAAAPDPGAPAQETAGYTLTVEDDATCIEEDAAPLAAAPERPEECCALHLVLMVAALGVTVCYIHNRKQSQAEEYRLRCDLLD